MTDSAGVLELVHRALGEFDDRPLDVSLRRAVRIASLMGDSFNAVRLGLDLMPIGGDPTGNREAITRLLQDPAMWHDPAGPHEAATEEYFKDRRVSRTDEKIVAHSVPEMEFWESEPQQLNPREMNAAQYADWLSLRLRHKQILTLIRHRVFTLLCAWERQLTFTNVNERIFTRYQNEVDDLLARTAPQILERFNSVYRRLREAADIDPGAMSGDELSQAVTSCRRILKAVADRVYPPTDAPGSDMDDSKYRNRLREFIKRAVDSNTLEQVMLTSIVGLYDRFAAVDKLSNKGVHADLAVREAELCAITTYILAGEILRIGATTTSD